MTNFILVVNMKENNLKAQNENFGLYFLKLIGLTDSKIPLIHGKEISNLNIGISANSKNIFDKMVSRFSKY